MPISLLGGVICQTLWRILKAGTRFPTCVPLQPLTYLSPLTSYLACQFWLVFPYPRKHLDSFRSHVQPIQQFLTWLPVTQLYTTHPSDRHPFILFVFAYILYLHCPRLAAIDQHTTSASPIHFPSIQRSPPCRYDGGEFPKLSACTLFILSS
jgi:hypothetical protein